MITQQELKEILKYDEITGSFIWLVDRGSNKTKGKVAGFITKRGYRKISINRKDYPEHRLAMLYVYGIYFLEIDHIDQNRANNKISNLRAVSHRDNGKNQSKWANNTTGVTGVYKNKNSWTAQITSDGTRYYLGSFKSIEDASDARQIAEKEFNFHANHGKELKNEEYRD